MSNDIIANKYRIVREIARSNDAVYEAVEIASGRKIALKLLVIPPNLTGQGLRERIERFNREARAAAKLSHPNIVTIFDHGEDGGRHYIAMEFLEGSTVRDMMQARGPFSTADAVDIACQVLEALSHAHSHRVIHRDVKPDNMHVIPGGQVKLTDFGIARMTEESSMTAEGQVFGTPSYMSPEQIKGKNVDQRSDLFSVAIVLYEMLAGRKPFTGDSVISITYAIMEAQPPPINGISFGLERVIFKALSKDPIQRFNSADEMRRELRNADSMIAPSQSMGGMGTFGNTGGYGTYGGGYSSQQQPSVPSYGGGGVSQNWPPPAATPGSSFPNPPPIYSPPPPSNQGMQTGSQPFVNWQAAMASNPAAMAPPPFPSRKAEPIFSESTRTFFKAMVIAIIVGAAVLACVLLFLSAYAQQQKKGLANAVIQNVAAGKTKLEAGDYSGAAAVFEANFQRARGTDAENTVRDGLVISYNHLGIKAYEQRDFRIAEDWWFKALAIDPNNEDVNANIRRVYDAIGSKDSRLEDWRSNGSGSGQSPGASSGDNSIQVKVQEAQTFLTSGEAAMQKGEYDTARKDLQKVVEMASGTDIAQRALNDLNQINLKQTEGSQYLQ